MCVVYFFQLCFQGWEVIKYKYLVTVLKYMFKVSVVGYLFYWQLLTLPPCMWAQICTFSSSHFKNKLVTSVWIHLREIMDYLLSLHAAFPTSQHWFQPYQCTSRTADVARWPKDVRRQEQTERETGMGRKGELVCRICRDPAALCLGFLIFSLCCCSGRFNNPTCVYLMSWKWDSTVKSLCGVFRNSWDKSYLFYL